jgi:hypothetical protein
MRGITTQLIFIIFSAVFAFILPAVSNANGYYDSLLNGLTGINVKEFYDINSFHDESENSVYKMEVERVTDGYLYDRISGYYIEILSTCRMDSSIHKALLVKGNRMRQLFLDNGSACGIKDIFIN